MLSFISKLQRKPEPVRRQIAAVSAFALTTLIALLWLVSLSSGGGAAQPTEKEPRDGPFSAVVDALGGFAADVGTMTKELRQSFRGESTVYPESAPY